MPMARKGEKEGQRARVKEDGDDEEAVSRCVLFAGNSGNEPASQTMDGTVRWRRRQQQQQQQQQQMRNDRPSRPEEAMKVVLCLAVRWT
ncbi:hypothetical protein CKAH01_02588 [Colletotrichum kahawae]|uniref:Uncharacterized protein n=1 Tax=Colletotrichum kahawae TaxID=34407 RepID=A0AAE0CY20_COLKA|nr:hypothetical protein CKAH01_02588 [Colletotrichum kahawae]